MLGLVPSLFKQEWVNGLKGRPGWEDWREQRIIWERQIDILLEVLHDDPALRRFIVGIDAAGQERGCPPPVLASAFKKVRRYNRHLGPRSIRPGGGIPVGWLGTLLRNRSIEEVYEELTCTRAPFPRLGITCHAGEDFVDPLTGLRHIWEAVESLQLGPGDRIGHALAAALDKEAVEKLLKRRAGGPSTPAKSTPRAEVERLNDGRFRLHKPRAEHLLDLDFVLRHGPPDMRETARAQLASALAGLGGLPDPKHLLRHPPLHRDAVPVLTLPHARYSRIKHLEPEAREWVLVDEAYLERLEAMRQATLRLLRERQLTVESCPSSNVAVANLDDPPIVRFLEENAVRVVLATDDPGLFESFPRDEVSWVRELGVDEDRLRRALEAAETASFVWRETRDPT